MNFNSGFNPVSFLYLNPVLCVASNLNTIEDARDFWMNYSNSSSNLWCNMDFVPSALDPAVFICEQKDFIDVSMLNRTIGLTSICDLQGTFEVPTIYRSVYNIGSNTLQFNRAGDSNLFYITPSNLNEGDTIKLVKGNDVPVVATVTSILDDRTFMVDELIPPFNFFASYTLWGIKLYDPMRLARVNYLTWLALSNEAIGSSNFFTVPDVNVNVDSNFNDALYGLLYPDARGLDRETAFIDYTNRLGNNDVRVANVVDLLQSQAQTGGNTVFGGENTYLRVNVTQHLNLDFGQETGRLTWNGINLFYVTDNPYRSYADTSPFYQGLITEWAIKSYIKDLFWPIATFSNLEVLSNANFRGNTHMSNLMVSNLEVLTSLQVDGYATFNSNVVINDSLVGGRIGVGHTPVHAQYAFESNVPNCNVVVDNLYVEETAFVSETLQVAGQLIGTCATFGSEVSGTRFGIGPLAQHMLSNPIVTLDALIISSNLYTANMNVAGFLTSANVDAVHVVSSYDIRSPIIITSNLVSSYIETATLNVSNTILCQNVSANSAQYNTLTFSNGTCLNVFTTSNLNVTGTSFFQSTVRIGTGIVTTGIVLEVGGLVQAQNIDPSSDIKLKKNIRPSTMSNVVSSLSVKEFEYKRAPGKRKLGFLAQDLECVFPDAVYVANGYRNHVGCMIPTMHGKIMFGGMYPLTRRDKVVVNGVERNVVDVDEDGNCEIDDPIADAQEEVWVDALVFDEVKMIDYPQVIAALCLDIQMLRRQITNCPCGGSTRSNP